MSFRVGQRVKIIAGLVPEHAQYIGAVGTVVSEGSMQPYPRGFGELWSYQVRWDTYGLMGFEPAKCLAPLDDDADFERFMENVLKPLPEPVTS